MAGKPDFLNHRAVSSKGGIARAKNLSATERAKIASMGGKISAAKKRSRKAQKQKQRAKAIQLLKQLVQTMENYYLADGTNVAGLLRAMLHELEDEEGQP